MTRFMWCSTRSTVSSKSSRIFWMKTPSSETSSWFSPPAGSSRRSSRGLATSARASSTRFWIPYGNAAAGNSARSREPDDVEDLERLGLPHLPPAAVRADEHVLEHGHRPEELDVLERARDALAHDLVRGCLEDRRAVEQHLAGVRPVEPRDDVEGRRLAGAVRPDQAGDVSFLDVERHAVERDDSAEAQGDVPYLEEGHPQETLNGPGARWQRSAGGLAQTRMLRLGARSRTDQSCTTDPAGTRTLTESTPRAFVTRVPPSQLQPPLRRIRRR